MALLKHYWIMGCYKNRSVTTRIKFSVDNQFALFTNGSPFSTQVVQALSNRKLTPSLIALPGYGPPKEQQDCRFQIASTNRKSRFQQLIAAYPKHYLQQTQQEEIVAQLRTIGIDFILVACWPFLIRESVVRSAGKAALNLHPSLLPADRGPDPISAQLKRDTPDFGVSLHLLSPVFDSGDIVLQKRIELEESSDRNSLEKAAAVKGVALFNRAVRSYHSGWNLKKQKPID